MRILDDDTLYLSPAAADPDDDEQDDDGDEDEVWDFDCGMTEGGLCLRAGSEDCDWECPYRGELDEDDDEEE
jgi:hypothetical protein